MAPPDRRLRALLIAGAVIVALVLAIVLVRGRGGTATGDGAAASAGAGSASGTGGDAWGGDRNADPAAVARLRGRGGSLDGLGLGGGAAGPPVTVTGVVRMMPAGTPAAGAEVAFFAPAAGENTAIADGNGRYAIQVASGVPWKVHARTEAAIGAPETFVPGPTATSRDLEVRPTGTVRGRVLDARGAPVTGAEVSVVVDAGARGLLESAMPLATTSEGGGRFELPALPGPVTVRAVKGLAQGLGQVGELGPGQTAEVELRMLEPAVVSGRVVDPDGKPLGGARLIAWATLAPGNTEKYQLEAGADGSFQLTVPAGGFRIEARHDGNVSRAFDAWNESGSRRDGVVLTVAPPTTVRGKVVTSDGRPVVGARIRLNQSAAYDATSGADGGFSVAVPEGPSYIVKIRHPEGRLDTQIGAWGEQQTFVLPRLGGLRVRATGAGDAPVAGDLAVTISQFVPTGADAPRAPAETRFRGTGMVAMTDLEPGRYALTVSAGGRTVTVPEAVVAEGETRDIRVTITDK